MIVKNMMVGILVIFLSIVLIMIVLISNKTQEQAIFYCYQQNWEGGFTGDLELSCSQIYEYFFVDNKWTEMCSNSFITAKPSCHTLCNIDCEIKNKELNRSFCIC